jgi:hypothetical protein
VFSIPYMFPIQTNSNHMAENHKKTIPVLLIEPRLSPQKNEA